MTVSVNGITHDIKKPNKIIRSCTVYALVISLILCSILLGVLPAKQVYASAYAITANKTVIVDGRNGKTVRALYWDYANNAYFSVRDIAVAMNGSAAQFDVAVGDEIQITTGKPYGEVGGENTPWSEEQLEQTSTDAASLQKIKLNGETVKYGAFTRKNAENKTDAYMSVIDLAMLLDIKVSLENDGSIVYDTSSKFAMNPEELEKDGFFYGVNGICVGDVTTNEVYYGSDENEVYPIASTSKLMSYAVIMDAVAAGEIAMDDIVTIDAEVEKLASSPDGAVKLKQGDKLSVTELLNCVLLPSSNESALALAKHIAGSESAFVERMNRKAADLGMTEAVFFNCNGLPVFTESVAPAKCQNRMSAHDMFVLTQYIFDVHPQVTDITSQKKVDIESINLKIENTNALLYNMPEVTGLKTGTTTKSGACLIASLAMPGADRTHNLVVVVLGTETSIDRVRVSEILARYAKNEYLLRNGMEGGTEYNEVVPKPVEEVPEDPELLIEYLIDYLRMKK